MGGLKPRSLFRRAKSYLPRGRMLDEETFAQRHRMLCWILGMHLPALLLFGMWQGYDVGHVGLELQVPLVCLLAATLLKPSRLTAFFTTAGLVYCSAALVHMSGGMIEAHFHFFILIGFIALYQDWVPFLWNVCFVVLSHGLGSSMAADSMFNHYAAQNRPWLWASIHGVSVLAACIGVICFWHQTELVQHRNLALREQLTEAELATTEAELARRESVSAILVHLARRNQSLLARQLSLIADLEERERRPEPMADLFRLDHLATRMRRNAESLLVLSGDESPRHWGRPVPLDDVARAAAAEVEAYERVNVLVTQHLEVEGRAVADLTHLLAELIENAIGFSAPRTEVLVNCYVAPGNSGYVVSVEDQGVGLSEHELHIINQILSDQPDIELGWETLGLHVVSRLAKRYAIDVRLSATAGQGVTAMVTLPNGLVHERSPETAPLTDAVSVLPAGMGASPPLASSPPQAHDLRRAYDAPRQDPTDPGAWRMADPESAARMVLQSGAGFGTPSSDADDDKGGHHDQDRQDDNGLGNDYGYRYGLKPAPLPAQPEVTAAGLVRRVPGRNLAEARRQMAAPKPHTGEALGGDEARANLSLFQASQRAGRAAAEAEDAATQALEEGEYGSTEGERGAWADVYRDD